MRPIRDSSVAGWERARVLLVEPDERSRSVMETTLGRQGFQIAAVASAEGAQLQLAPGRPLPSVVVCEAALQGADGFALCQQIRDEPRTAMLPLILLSRRPERRHPGLARRVGADDYIAKPAFANDVVALVHLRAGASSFDTSLRSSTSVVPLPKLLRALLAGIRSGRVELENGGLITFREGLIVDAVLDRLQGTAALTRMLLLSQGDYAVTLSSGPAQASFSLNLEELCTTVFWQISRWEKETASGPSLDLKLMVNFGRLGAVLSRLPAEVKELIRLCDGRRTVRQCLLEGSLSESLAFAAIARLQELRVLTPVPEPASEEESPVAAATADKTWNVISLWSLNSSGADQRPRAGESGAPGDPPIPLVDAIDAPAHSPSNNPVLPPDRAQQDLALAAADTDDGAPAKPGTVKGARRPAVQFLAAALGVVILAAGAAWVARKAKDRTAAGAIIGGAAVAARGQSPSPAPFGIETLPGAPMGIALNTDGELAPDGEGRVVEAIRALAKATASDPSATSWLMLGRARFDAGDKRGAEEAATRALEMNPGNGGAMMLRANVFLATHQREKAAEELARYLETEPDGPFAEEARQLLSSW